MRILLVEDDSIIGDGIVAGLSKQGFVVDWIKDGQLAQGAPQKDIHDLIILDLSLPHVDGLDLLRQWRSGGHTIPILILTARNTIEQKVEGLNLGADDYLPKPFALIELVARVRALQRRHAGQSNPILKHGKVSLDPQKRIAYLNDEPMPLTPKLLILLETFLLHQDAVLSRSLLEEKLYGWNEDVSSNAIEVHIHHLRSKLGSSFIKTVHGIGYTLGK